MYKGVILVDDVAKSVAVDMNTDCMLSKTGVHLLPIGLSGLGLLVMGVFFLLWVSIRRVKERVDVLYDTLDS